jgi:hypothetical protein
VHIRRVFAPGPTGVAPWRRGREGKRLLEAALPAAATQRGVQDSVQLRRPAVAGLPCPCGPVGTGPGGCSFFWPHRRRRRGGPGLVSGRSGLCSPPAAFLQAGPQHRAPGWRRWHGGGGLDAPGCAQGSSRRPGRLAARRAHWQTAWMPLATQGSWRGSLGACAVRRAPLAGLALSQG